MYISVPDDVVCRQVDTTLVIISLSCMMYSTRVVLRDKSRVPLSVTVLECLTLTISTAVCSNYFPCINSTSIWWQGTAGSKWQVCYFSSVL